MKSCFVHRETYKFIAQTSIKTGVYSVFLLCCISSLASASAQTNNSTQLSSDFETTQIQKKPTQVQKTQSQQSDAAVQLTPIVVHASQNSDFNHTSQTELSRVAVLTTPDLLKGQVGVHVGDANGGALDVNIRAVQGQSRVAISVDGAEQSLDVYRGYAGMQNRSYIDPLLISSVDIKKGPSTQAGGAVGGSVAMQSLGVDDILIDGQQTGARITGQFGDNGTRARLPPRHRDDQIPLERTPAKGIGNLSNAESRSGSVATAWRSSKVDLIAAYVERVQGNYFSGRHGWSGYRSFDESGTEEQSVAKAYTPGEEVLNSSASTKSLLLKSILRPTDTQQIDLSYINTQSEYGDVMPSDLIREGSAGQNQYPLGQNRIQSLSAKYKFKPSDQAWLDLEATLWGSHAKTNQLSASFFSPNSLLFRADRAWSPLDNQRAGLELSNKTTWNPAWGQVVMTLSGAAKYERLKPQSGVAIDLTDIYSNKILRDAARQEYSGGLRLDYQPMEQLRVWTGLNYSENKSQDYNKIYFPIKENRKLKQIEVWDEKNDYLGYMYWLPDENGEYTDATDPRLNNSVVFTNTNQPFSGKHFNELSKDASISVYDEEELATIARFDGRHVADQQYHALSPYIGAEYDFNGQVTGFVSYTVQSRLPSLLESSLGTHQVVPGKNLNPEIAKSWELGFKTDHQNGLNTKLSYFNQNYENYITRYYLPSAGGVMTFSNMDAFNTSGLEFQLKYNQPGYFVDFAASHYLKVESCDAKFAQKLRDSANQYSPTGNTPNCTSGGFMGSYLNMQNPPKFSSYLTLGVYALDQRLTFGVRSSYHSKPMSNLNQPWQTSATTSQLHRQPVYLMDVFADYKLHKNMALNFSIQNLTNQYYLEPMASSFMPAPGRSMNVGVKLFF